MEPSNIVIYSFRMVMIMYKRAKYNMAPTHSHPATHSNTCTHAHPQARNTPTIAHASTFGTK